MSVIAARMLINNSEALTEDFSKNHPIPNGIDLSDFFNNNIRLCLDYYYIILKHIMHMSTFKPGGPKPTHPTKMNSEYFSSLYFSYDYVSNSMSMAYSKRYKFVKSLLIGMNNEYHNLTMTTNKRVPLEIYGKRICPERLFPELMRSRGALCDNVFNYHRDFETMLDHKATVPSLFEKVRMLQILICEQNNKKTMSESYITVENLKYYMENWFGHIYPNIGDLYVNLQILVHAEFVCLKDSCNGDFDENSLQISITRLGRYIVENICHRIEYIEHVILRTNLPKNLRSIVSIPSSGCGMTSNKIWRISAIRNFYLFYQYARWVESIEELYTKDKIDVRNRDIQIPNWKISTRMMLNKSSIEAMIKSNDKKYVSGQSMEWSTDFLQSVIADIDDAKKMLSNIDRL